MALPFKQERDYGKEVMELGKGTYGYVMMTDAFYAIKTFESDNGFFEQSSLIEIVSLLKVASPYVIPLIDVIIDLFKHKLVLPLADNTLSFFMRTVSLDVKSLVRQCCLGLADIHNADLLHLDLKPDNLLLHNIKEGYANAKLWIADLGISKIHTCAFPPHNDLLFTLWYRPPELMLNGPVSQKCDVWALGVTIAELLVSQVKKERYHLLPGGSEYDELLEIFRLFGTPSEGDELRSFPEWNDQFPMFKNTFRRTMKAKGLDEASIDFLEFILRVNPSDRPSIFEVLQHPWLELDKDKIPKELTCWERLELYSHYPNYAWMDKKKRYSAIGTLLYLTYLANSSYESLALSVYLLDRLVSLNKDIENSNIYVVACHYIAAEFYDNVSLNDYISFLHAMRRSRTELRDAINKILRWTSFDLAPATSYFFLSRLLQRKSSDYRLLAKQVWVSSLYTMTHFEEPSLLADTILSIVTKESDKNPLALDLLEEIKLLPDDLPIHYSNDIEKPLSDIKDKLF